MIKVLIKHHNFDTWKLEIKAESRRSRLVSSIDWSLGSLPRQFGCCSLLVLLWRRNISSDVTTVRVLVCLWKHQNLCQHNIIPFWDQSVRLHWLGNISQLCSNILVNRVEEIWKLQKLVQKLSVMGLDHPHLFWWTQWRETLPASADPLWAAPRGSCPAWGWSESWGSPEIPEMEAALSVCYPAGAALSDSSTLLSPKH